MKASYQNPLVSVVISNYNYGAYLADAIDSVLGQTYPRTETIVVDDGSTDESIAVIDGFADRVTPLFNEHRGQLAALNTGFTATRGEILIFLDADDYLLPDAIERLVEPFLDAPAIAKSQGYMDTIDGQGIALGKRVPGRLSPSGDYRDATLEQGPWLCRHALMSGNAWARWYLDEVLPLPEGRDNLVDADGCLNPVSALFGPIATVDGPVACYRLHGRNSGPRGAVFSLDSLLRELQRPRDSFDFFAQRARRFGFDPDYGRVFRRARSWRYFLMAHSVGLMDAAHGGPSFSELVSAPFLFGSTGKIKAAAMSVALTLVWLAPRKASLVLARRLLGLPAGPGQGIVGA